MKFSSLQNLGRGIALFGVVFLFSAWDGQVARANPAARKLLDEGKKAFIQGQYEKSKELLQQAESQDAKDIETQMWLGLILYADGREWEAMSAWRNGVGNPRWEPIADYLRGLGWWKMNRSKDAIDYFKEAQLDTVSGKSVQFAPAREAIAKVQAGEPAPEINDWPDISTLSKGPSLLAASAKTSGPTVSSAKNKSVSQPAPQGKQKTGTQKGSKPRSGRWVATVHNGYKGDKLTFRVSADGKRIEKVEFTGHWMNRDSSSGMAAQLLRNLDPPQPFAVTGGAFSAVQQVSKSRMWWEFTGRFTSASTAEGTYRCAYAGGQNDTYKLKWTARYVGS